MIRLAPRLTTDAARALWQTLAPDVVAGDAQHISLDCSAVTFLGAAALQVLLMAQASVGPRGGSLRLESPSDGFLRDLSMLGAAGHLEQALQAGAG